jgi:hypothetical protein
VSNELLEKVIQTTQLGSEKGLGLLPPEQADRFITYVWDATVIGSETRKIRMRSDTVELDRMAVGERILRVATEAVDDHVNVAPAFSKISLTTSKLRLDWELSTEALEDGIEGDNLEDTVARLMAGQIGNDLEDLIINGDSRSPDPLMRAFDGYRLNATRNGGTQLDNGGETVSRGTFHRMLRNMDRRYMQKRNNLRFYAGSNIVADYLTHLYNAYSSDAQTNQQFLNGNPAVEPGGGYGQKYNLAFGVPVFEVPLFAENLNREGTDVAAEGQAQHGSIELTFPQNRIFGIKREIKVFREFKPKKDTIEYTVFTRCGAAVENPDAFIVMNGVKIDDFGQPAPAPAPAPEPAPA